LIIAIPTVLASVIVCLTALFLCRWSRRRFHKSDSSPDNAKFSHSSSGAWFTGHGRGLDPAPLTIGSSTAEFFAFG
jgi:hypothetical protein